MADRSPPFWLRPFDRFFRLEAIGGMVLLFAASLALVWANSGLGGAYEALWAAKLNISLGGNGLDKALILWVNDGLMAVFIAGLALSEARLAEAKVGTLVASAIAGMLGLVALKLASNQSARQAESS